MSLRFLKNRDKVKVTIMFRGREMYHPERGRSLLLRLADDVKDLAMIESDPLQDGRNMVMMLAPHKEAVAVKPASEAGRRGARAQRRDQRAAAAETAPEPRQRAPEDEHPAAARARERTRGRGEAEAQAETPVTPA